jgi:lysophospholipase L1-like esterase
MVFFDIKLYNLKEFFFSLLLLEVMMVIYENIELHNVTELEANKAINGVILRRIPRRVREELNERGKIVSSESSGCELRFVTPAPRFTVSLFSQTNGQVIVYKGDYLHSKHHLSAGQVKTLDLSQPERFSSVQWEVLSHSRFSPDVWRIFIGRNIVTFVDIETFGHPIRPPKENEKPHIRMLSYGSSITHGPGDNNQLTYVYEAARRSHIDVYNLGLSGACHCEHKMSDFIANRDDWDMATLELGINMRIIFEPKQFKERVHYLLDQLIERYPKKPIALITIYPNFGTHPQGINDIFLKEEAFNETLREYILQKNHKQLYLLEGENILSDFSGLSCDLLHPSETGYIYMAENLSFFLKRMVKAMHKPTRE